MGGSSYPDPEEAIKYAIIYMGFDAKLNKAHHFKRILNSLMANLKGLSKVIKAKRSLLAFSLRGR
jgi:hypothetical protein